MRVSFRIGAALIAALTISACSAVGSSGEPGSVGSRPGVMSAKHAPPEWLVKHQARPDCPQVVGKPSCFALRVLNVPAACNPSASCGFTAQQLEEAYGLTKKLNKGANTVVALIENGDYSAAASDIATYRTQYGLGKANIQRYSSSGQQSNLPSSCEDFGWCVETALDFDMVSATCPKCTIYLMEANGSTSDMEKAEATAVTLGAKILSNSWGCYGDSTCGDPNFANYFNTKGVAYLAASGDAGYGEIGGPAILASVIAVGGTQLEASGKKFTESAWNGASAGCGSASVVGTAVPKPSWQSDPGCSYRTATDISAEAGCSPGVAMYSGLYGGWFFECGTSAASPLVAGVVALAGNATKLNAGQSIWQMSAKQMKKRLNAVTTGNDGSCGGSYLCTAGTGQFGAYSGPTGWGTPKTIKAL
jgi:subtilase family serine protease